MWSLENPMAFYLLLGPLIAFFYLWKKKRKFTPGRQLISPGPIDILRKESRAAKNRMRGLFGLGVIALIGMVFVYARPVKHMTQAKKHSLGIDIAIVLDVSESMEATDFEPNRITIAKQVIRDFIEKRENDRIGLVLFGGESITKSPLTRDHDFLQRQVEDIVLRELKQGTAIGMGLTNGISRLRQSESKTKIIVLLTDGDSNVGSINPITAAHLARQEGIRVYTIGIGKENRVVVPIYSYDAFGQKTHLLAQVPSYINPELLSDIAKLTGGKSYMARDPGMLSQVLSEIDHLEKSRVKILTSQRRQEEFFIPGLLATGLLISLLLLHEFRFRPGAVVGGMSYSKRRALNI